MSLNRRISSNGFWNITENPAAPQSNARDVEDNAIVAYDPFKLHIAINPAYLPTVKSDLEAMLDEASLALAVSGYKSFIAVNSPSESSRTTHWSFTVYLPIQYSHASAIEIARLCRNIQTLLTRHHVPTGDFAQLTECDLALSPNISFRCSTLDLNAPEDQRTYCGANANTPPEYIQIMKRLGETSDFYRTLRAILTADAKLEIKSEVKASSASASLAKTPETKMTTAAATTTNTAATKTSGPFNLFAGLPPRHPHRPAALNLRTQSNADNSKANVL